MNIHVDTLKYANDLEQAGIQRAHAEAIAKLQARAIGDLVEHELVTRDFLKGELAVLRNELKDEIRKETASLRDEMRKDSSALQVQLRSLQYGGAIAAFAVSLMVLFSRLIG